MRLTTKAILTVLLLGFGPALAQAAGTLTPIGSPEQPVEIAGHNVAVRITNGFARTEVRQVFYNPNPYPLEAVYAFPVPASASLAEVTLQMGENSIDGEVVERELAERIYTEERDQGNEAGIAVKDEYRTFEFAVSPLLPESAAEMRFVYYQPLEIDTGVGRYVYPLEDGGTDEDAASFWTANERVDGPFSIEVELESAWPVADLRIPGLEQTATIERRGDGQFFARVESASAVLNRDFVLYYRLSDGLPGRVEVIPYRADPQGWGTFMAVVTPGIDLQPLTGGADYAFVLDVSGSMSGKLAVLADGVVRALGRLNPNDRFRVVLFNDDATDLTRGWVQATPENVRRAAERVTKVQSGGSTNLYAGIARTLKGLDDDRATSVVLVTDGVTNTSVIDPEQFHQLMRRYDVRLFGFLMGNSANWPLMRTISEASGGFYSAVSNADDIVGQIMLAQGKVTHAALHDAEFKLRGVKTAEVTGLHRGKIYHGQQLVLFGRYREGGSAELRLDARLTGLDKTYTTSFEFPDIDTDNPEIERLWAMSRIEEIETLADAGLADATEAKDAVRDLAVQYQIVTDETAMLVLSDEDFARHGVERRNRTRVQAECAAQTVRQAAGPRNYRVDSQAPTYSRPAPSLGGGGAGAIDPLSGLLALGLLASARLARRRRGGMFS